MPQALAVKEELEKIDELLKQLEEARKTAQIGIIDMDLLSEFAEPGDVDQLSALQQQVQDYLRQMAEQQGLEQKAGSYRMTPKAYAAISGQATRDVVSVSWRRRGPAGITGRSSAKARSNCKRRRNTSSATRSRTSISRARSSTRSCAAGRARRCDSRARTFRSIARATRRSARRAC